MSDFKPLFDEEDPRNDPNRDPKKPVLPEHEPRKKTLKQVQREERITDPSIRVRSVYPKLCVPLSEPCQCDGTLWLKPTHEGKVFHHSHPDGRVLIACSCYAAELQGKTHDYLWDNSGLVRGENIPKLSDFKDDLSPDAKYAKDTVVEWMNDKSAEWVIIIGTPGLGKTHLAKSATANLVGLGKPVIFATVRDILSKSRSWIGKKQNDKWIRYLAQLEDIKYLVLDDLGQEYATDWSRQVLFDIIDTRYETRNPTLITTNIPTSGWSEYLGSACADRLQDFALTKHIIMNGASVRRKASR